MKTKLILTRFVGNFGTVKFSEKYIFLLGFTPYWDFKTTNAIHAGNPGVQTSDKNSNLSTTDKIHLKRDVIDGSVLNGVRQPLLFSFNLKRPDGCKIFCEPETIHFKIICFENYKILIRR